MDASGKKRKRSDEDENQSKSYKRGNFLSLKQSMNDPNLVVQQSETYVVIKDKYPKVRI